MSRIFVVQPYRMLQQAVIVALFPEHQVRVSDHIPESEPSSDADLAIIDVGALRDRSGLSAGDMRAVQSWQLPIVWIGSGGSGEGTAVKNSLQLTAPLKRDELRAAVTEALRSTKGERAGAAPARKRAHVASSNKRTVEQKPDGIVADNEREVIELVEVIEDAPGDAREAEAGNES